MLVPFLPNTLSGGQTRWYNLIKQLSKNHEITLFSLIKEDSEKKYIPELKKYCKKVLVFKRPGSPWTLRNLFLTAVSFYPLVVIRNLSFEEKRVIKRELDSEEYDVIHAETFYVMPHLSNTKTPVVLVEPTIEFSVYRHYVDHEVPFLLKPIYLFDILKLKYWEKYYWRKADKLFAVSEEDRKVMRRETSDIDIGVIPNGVDLDFFKGKKASVKKDKRILYVGNYSWMQNVEAVDLLAKKIWPEIKKRVKRVKLRIVGVNMTEGIKSLHKKDKNIEITEGIPDIRDAYNASSVLVAPIKGPGGTRLKVLEAMASALPVVSTPVGVAGLHLKSKRDALVSQDIDEIVDFTVKVLNNPKFAEKIGANARDFVAKNFDWKSIVKKLDMIYREVTN